MAKKYKIEDTSRSVVSSPELCYSKKLETIHLDVTIEDGVIMSDIKKMLEMIKGISSVRIVTKKKKMSGIDNGLEDIKKGNVFYAKDSSDLVKQIFG